MPIRLQTAFEIITKQFIKAFEMTILCLYFLKYQGYFTNESVFLPDSNICLVI